MDRRIFASGALRSIVDTLSNMWYFFCVQFKDKTMPHDFCAEMWKSDHFFVVAWAVFPPPFRSQSVSSFLNISVLFAARMSASCSGWKVSRKVHRLPIICRVCCRDFRVGLFVCKHLHLRLGLNGVKDGETRDGLCLSELHFMIQFSCWLNIWASFFPKWNDNFNWI